MLSLTASLLSIGFAAIDRNPCGVPGAKQLLAYAAFSDHEAHRLKVDEPLQIEVSRAPDEGPILVRDASSHAPIYSVPRSGFDGFVPLPNGQLPYSTGAVLRVRLRSGTLIIDPSVSLSRDGGYVFVCWKNNEDVDRRSKHHSEVYADTDVSDADDLVIRRTDGSTIPFPQLRNQVEVEKVQISPDGTRIGWLVDMPAAGVSYAVPQVLVIYRKGTIERAIEVGQAIFDWHFEHDGTAVAYYQGTLHFSNAKEFSLRDIRSDRLLDTYSYPDGPPLEVGGPEYEAREEAIEAAPEWVRAFAAPSD